MRDVIVVGGGVGGLASAALLQAAGHRVLLLEARDYVGGCAATFHHGGRASEAGATWLTGLDPGQPLHRLFARIGLDADTFGVRETDPMACVFRGRTVRRYADPLEWNQELARQFGQDVPRFWTRVHREARAQWERVERFPALPPGSAGEWFRTAGRLRPRDVTLAGALLPTSSLVAAAGLRDLTPLLDAQLMITTQAPMRSVPWLYGAPGLDFAALPARFVPGGIGGVARAIFEQFCVLGGEAALGQRVVRVTRCGRGWDVETEAGERFGAAHVVMNLTHGAAAEVLPATEATFFRKRAGRHPAPWSAFDIHFRQPDVFPPDGPRFFQVVLDEPLPIIGASSFFVTVSPPGDPVLSQGNMRNVNLSTHTPVEHWWRVDRERYHRDKVELTELLLQKLGEALPQFFHEPREGLHSGTPRTFAQFVGRSNGAVGGFPLTYRNLPWRVPGSQTPYRGLWQVGDNVFPGQSIPGVAFGAMYLVDKLGAP